MKLNRRQLIAATTATGTLALAGGGAWWVLRDDGGAPTGASRRIDLPAGAYTGLPHRTEPVLYAMLSITGGMPDNTALELRLFDLNGLPYTEAEQPTVTLANLVTAEQTDDVQLEPIDGGWRATKLTIASDGWWQVVASFGELTANWTFLIPDPNLTGFTTPPVNKTDPAAQAMLAAALDTLTRRTSLRWWQWLSGGNGAIILSRFAVTTPESNGQPAAFESHAILAGRIPLDGTGPSFRGENTRTISTARYAEVSINGGTPQPTDTLSYLPIAEYASTYAGYDGVTFGTTAYIESRRCQLVAFHLPGAIEAWFAFWIDTESLFVRELFMISVNHYMHWVYEDFDAPFVLEL